MQSFIRKVVSLDSQSIDIGSKRAQELGLSFSSFLRLLIHAGVISNAQKVASEAKGIAE